MKQPATIPSRKGYLVAALMLVVSLILAGLLVAYFVMSILGIADEMQQVVLPQGGVVTLSEPGVYTVFYEHESSVAGQHYSTSSHLPTMTITIKEAAGSGGLLPVSPASMNTNYHLGSRSGYSVWTFDAPQAGDYRIEGSYNHPGEPDRVFAIGKGMTSAILLSLLALFAAIGIGGIGLITALVLGIVTLVRRQSAGEKQPAA